MTLHEAIKVIKPSGNSAEDLTAAYRLLAKKYHPDINPDGAGYCARAFFSIALVISCIYLASFG